MSSTHHPAAEVKVTAKPPLPPGPATPHGPSAFAEIQTVVELTDLHANAGMASRLTNLSTSNITTTTNNGAQNAVANQQAHSQLALSITGKTANRVQNLGPLTARSVVDVLTNNEIAQTLMDLKGAMQGFAGGGGGRRRHPLTPAQLALLRRTLAKVVLQIKAINEKNSHLTGNGKLSNVQGGEPFTITDQPLFVQAGVTLGFYGVPPSKLNLEELRRVFRAT